VYGQLSTFYGFMYNLKMAIVKSRNT